MDQTLLDEGRALIAELGVESMTGRWMAHRLAEMMRQAKKERRKSDREAAAQECTALILALRDLRADEIKAESSRLAWSAQKHVAEVSEYYEIVSDALRRRATGARAQRMSSIARLNTLFLCAVVEQELLRLLAVLGARQPNGSDAAASDSDEADRLYAKMRPVFEDVSGPESSKRRRRARVIQWLTALSGLHEELLSGLR